MIIIKGVKRCSNCKHCYGEEESDIVWCGNGHLPNGTDDYCSEFHDESCYDLNAKELKTAKIISTDGARFEIRITEETAYRVLTAVLENKGTQIVIDAPNRRLLVINEDDGIYNI